METKKEKRGEAKRTNGRTENADLGTGRGKRQVKCAKKPQKEK